MGELFSKLGIDWQLLVAQIINFSVLLFILHRLLYKPLLNVLEKRRHTVEKSLKDAKEIEHQKKAMIEEKDRILSEAKKEGKKILETVADQAKKYQNELTEKAHEEAEKILAKAQKDLAVEKQRIMQEVRKEAADLVMSATEKVLLEKMSAESDRKLSEKFIRDIV